MSLPRFFWIVACGDVALALALLLKIATGPVSRYDWLVELLLLAFVVLVGAVMGVVALIRKPVAYGIGLALAAVPPLGYAAQIVGDFLTTPSEEAREAGRGYCTAPADRALANAIVAGDAAKVASLLQAANPNAVGWNGMTFMRLALLDGHANPDVVAALLRAGANPDQGQQMLFGSVNDGSEADSGAMITGKNERLLRAVIDAGVDLNHRDLEGQPRFFSALRWPEGLALILERGASVKAEDTKGNTAIMVAVLLWHWPAIDVLLAHGTGIEHVNHEGVSLRVLVMEKLERYRKDQRDAPPQLSVLAARLR
jgi:ankyrin repeat protein